jgi:probable rRNA maturation factor
MMAIMNKTHFLCFDFDSTVKLSSGERRAVTRAITLVSDAFHWALTTGELVTGIKARFPKAINLSLLLCGEGRIRTLNRQYRGKDKVTDVLSFPSFEEPRSDWTQVMLVEGVAHLGDIAICHQQTHRQAREFELSYEDEFIHLLVHGLLHLLGYDHERSPKEEKLMEEWEAKILSRISSQKKRAP